MKAILVIEVPDDINKPSIEYKVYSTEPLRKTRITGYRHLDPMPSKRISAVEWLNGIKTHEPTEYDKGWNDCVDFLENADEC